MVTSILRELAGPLQPPARLEKPCSRTAQQLIAAWDQVCRAAIQNGTAEDVHAERDDYRAILAGQLKILDGHLMVQARFPDEPPSGETIERLSRARDDLQSHYDALFPRWKTLEDLEAILLERISLPNDRLKALAAKHPPPQSWYDEDDATRRRRKRS